MLQYSPRMCLFQHMIVLKTEEQWIAWDSDYYSMDCHYLFLKHFKYFIIPYSCASSVTQSIQSYISKRLLLLFLVVLRQEPSDLHLLGKLSSSEPCSHPHISNINLSEKFENSEKYFQSSSLIMDGKKFLKLTMLIYCSQISLLK